MFRRSAPFITLVGVLAFLLAGSWRATVAAAHDLDAYSDAQLDRDLEAELDDIYADLPPDRLVADERIESEMLDALSDAGDDDSEDDIDAADLEDEMEEAGETLEEVVEAGVESADALARLFQRTTARIIHAAFTPAAQRRDGQTTPRLAVRQVKTDLRLAIRRQVRRE